jgi:hypothetical protein
LAVHSDTQTLSELPRPASAAPHADGPYWWAHALAQVSPPPETLVAEVVMIAEPLLPAEVTVTPELPPATPTENDVHSFTHDA